MLSLIFGMSLERRVLEWIDSRSNLFHGLQDCEPVDLSLGAPAGVLGAEEYEIFDITAASSDEKITVLFVDVTVC